MTNVPYIPCTGQRNEQCVGPSLEYLLNFLPQAHPPRQAPVRLAHSPHLAGRSSMWSAQQSDNCEFYHHAHLASALNYHAQLQLAQHLDLVATMRLVNKMANLVEYALTSFP